MLLILERKRWLVINDSLEDFHRGIAYLASDMPDYLTGQNIEIDGGFRAW